MDNKFLTPQSLWQDYKLNIGVLNLNIVNFYYEGDYKIKELYFNGLDSNVRAFARIIYPKEAKKSLPTLIYAGEPDKIMDVPSLIKLCDGKMAVATIDYGGVEEDNLHFTRYKEEYSYAMYKNAEPILSTGKEKEIDVWFLWGKLIRNFITLLCSDSLINAEKIVIGGLGAGSLLATHIAAVDKRVSALSIILGYGYPTLNKLDEGMLIEKSKLSEDDERWLSALSYEAYASYVNVPVLMLLASNFSSVNILRMSDLLDKFDNCAYSNISISARCSSNINEHNFNALFKFLKNVFKKSEDISLTPEVQYLIEDGYLKVTTPIKKKPKSVSLYLAHNQKCSQFRNWYEYSLAEDKKSDSYVANIRIDDFSDKLYFFVNANYKDYTLSSSFYTETIPHKEYAGGANRILYEGRYGLSYFAVEKSDLVIPNNCLSIKKGGQGINGISVNEGNLTTYILSDSRYKAVPSGALRMDIYSEKAENVIIKVSKWINNELVEYCASYEYAPLNKWDKINLELSDFKNDKLIVLKDWENIVKLQLLNAEQVLFNNILWV